MERSIALIGLPASGKSCVGTTLARLLGVDFVDLDGEIEKTAGSKILQIFAGEGEAGFRKRECASLAKLSGGRRFVLATGGGCIESPENRRALREGFFCVWLRIRPEAAAARALGDARPLLSGDAGSRMKGLHERRESLYAQCADLAIDVDDMTVDAAAETIREKTG